MFRAFDPVFKVIFICHLIGSAEESWIWMFGCVFTVFFLNIVAFLLCDRSAVYKVIVSARRYWPCNYLVSDQYQSLQHLTPLTPTTSYPLVA